MFGSKGCDHFWILKKKDDYMEYLIQFYECNKCGKPKTVTMMKNNTHVVKVE